MRWLPTEARSTDPIRRYGHRPNTKLRPQAQHKVIPAGPGRLVSSYRPIDKYREATNTKKRTSGMWIHMRQGHMAPPARAACGSIHEGHMAPHVYYSTQKKKTEGQKARTQNTPGAGRCTREAMSMAVWPITQQNNAVPARGPQHNQTTNRPIAAPQLTQGCGVSGFGHSSETKTELSVGMRMPTPAGCR